MFAEDGSVTPDPGHEKDKSRALKETGPREEFSWEFLGFLGLFVSVSKTPIKKGPLFLRLLFKELLLHIRL